MDFINEELCEFNNDASASSFGWNFQANAGIFLFLHYIKDAESIKIESKLQDIEIKMKSGNKILAQAKSSTDYSIAKNKKEKFKDSIISFAKYSNDNNKLIYISNIPDMLNTANNAFNNKIVSYKSCLTATKEEIDEIFAATLNSIDKKIEKESEPCKVSRLKRIKSNVENINKNSLYISVIYPFYGDEENRYTIIGDKILSFLVDDIKLSRDNAISIKQRLLEHWQLKFQHNSTELDVGIGKTISKTEFAWPITVFLTDEITPDIDDCLSFVPDIALKKEVESFMRNVNMLHHERFEFANKVIQSYAEYKKTKPVETKEIEKLFVKEYGKEFYNEFRFDDNEEKTEYLTKLFVYRIITNNININKISSNIGVEL